MKKYTKKQLKTLIKDGVAHNITYGNIETRKEIEKKEGYYIQVGYACGTYGCSGALLQGHNTGDLYAITDRTSALFIFI